MADKFKLVPYAGYNPNNATVYNIGIDTITSGSTTWKIASYIESNSFAPMAVYYCNVAGMCMFISEYSSSFYMRIKSTNNSSSDIFNVGNRYNITGSAVSVYYSSSASTTFIPSDFAELEQFPDRQSASLAFLNLFPDDYVNIQYVGNGCLIGGPSYVEEGTGVLVPVTLPIGTTLSADNISVTKNGASIDFNYNPQTQQIAFTAI
mgnify:CR=1 FL=1